MHLAWGDVIVDNLQTPTSVSFHLKRSKCDQFGNGIDVFVGRSGNELCPVVAILSYIARRGDGPGSFFTFSDGTPLTKAWFVARVQIALRTAGVQSNNYTGHSFRIGAATAAAKCWDDGAAQPFYRISKRLDTNWPQSRES